MLTRDKLLSKKDYYLNQIETLKNVDIEHEVDVRLAAKRDEIRKEITDDINDDIKTCMTYLSVLDSLLIEDATPDDDIATETETVGG